MVEFAWQNREIIQKNGRVYLVLKTPVGHKRVDITDAETEEEVLAAAKDALEWVSKQPVPQEEPEEEVIPPVEKKKKLLSRVEKSQVISLAEPRTGKALEG